MVCNTKLFAKFVQTYLKMLNLLFFFSVSGNLQNDFIGFQINSFLFLQSQKSLPERYEYYTTAFNIETKSYHTVDFPSESRSILGSCHVAVSCQNLDLLIKIGGYRLSTKSVLNTTDILKFTTFAMNLKFFQYIHSHQVKLI